MLNQFSRTELLFGKAAMEKLASSRVAVFGIGGVGGYTCEALVRSGVGAFDLIDDDKVCLTNLNRQIIATRKTVGKYKAEVMKERMLEINPDVKVSTIKMFMVATSMDQFFLVTPTLPTVWSLLLFVTNMAKTLNCQVTMTFSQVRLLKNTQILNQKQNLRNNSMT